MTQAARALNPAVPEKVMEALCDDLNTPKALAALSELSKNVDTPVGRAELLSAGALLGILQHSPDEWFQSRATDINVAVVDALIEERNAARQAKDYAAADIARDTLTQMGVAIEDTPNGTIWRVAKS
jgi:cysteinyl-tRNA synthetase